MSDLRKIKTMIDGDIEMLQEDIAKLIKHQQKALIDQSDALMCECGIEVNNWGANIEDYKFQYCPDCGRKIIEVKNV